MISLGIDVGGTGCKCAAFSEQGEQLAQSYEEYPLAAGAVSLPPEVLTQSVFHVIRRCAEQLANRSEIAAVTVSSFGESFVALGRDGKALCDIQMYFGPDESEAFDALVERVGAERLMEICRVFPNCSYSLANMLRTMQAFPRAVWKFLLIAGYLCYRLSGVAATDVSLACRSLLYDVQRGGWSRELLDASGIREDQLPQVVAPGVPVGTLLPAVAEALGLSPDTVVVMGAHDQIANALGAGVAQTGDAADASGTCECLTPLFPAIPDGLDMQKNNFACVPYLDSGRYVTYAYNISAGSVVRWVRDALAPHWQTEGKSVYDALNEAAPQEPTRLVVLPFLQGMGGTPEVDPAATGLIAGLTTQTRLPELYRAVLEGITFEMRYNMELLREDGVRIQRLLACGGGARSRVWLQIKADILGCDILPVRAQETGAMGSAILGLSAVTGKSPLAIAPRFRKVGEAIHPNPAHAETYDRRYAIFKQLRATYKEVSRCLSR